MNVGFVCYDDGCHLRKFSRNPVRSSLTTTAVKIAELEIVIDRMHFKGHIDSWCKQTCNPDNFSELIEVRAIRVIEIWTLLFIVSMLYKNHNTISINNINH